MFTTYIDQGWEVQKQSSYIEQVGFVESLDAIQVWQIYLELTLLLNLGQNRIQRELLKVWDLDLFYL